MDCIAHGVTKTFSSRHAPACGSQAALAVRNLPASEGDMETWVRPLGWKWQPTAAVLPGHPRTEALAGYSPGVARSRRQLSTAQEGQQSLLKRFHPA